MAEKSREYGKAHLYIKTTNNFKTEVELYGK